MTRARKTRAKLTLSEDERYAVLGDGRVLDIEPMNRGKVPLVFDTESGAWVDFDGTVGDFFGARPVPAEQATRLTAKPGSRNEQR